MFKTRIPDFKNRLKKGKKTDKGAEKIKEPEAEHKKTKPKLNILGFFKKKGIEGEKRGVEYYKKEIKKQEIKSGN